MSDREKRIKRFCDIVKDCIVMRSYPYSKAEFAPCGYKAHTPLPSELSPFPADGRWGDTPDSHALFRLCFDLPESERFSRLRLRIDTDRDGWNVYNPQFILYRDGKAVQGLDTNHRTAAISYARHCEFTLYAYTGSQACSLPLNARIEVTDPETEALYWDMTVPYEICLITEPDTRAYEKTMKALTDAADILDLRHPGSDCFRRSVSEARKYLRDNLYSSGTGDGTTAVCVGHTHIDIAWLWTLDQTAEKAQHSFATVLALLDRYPEFVFMCSQPQLFEYVKEQDPELYGRIKRYVAEGRIEPEGAMWVEADCNLPSGESLVRQIQYGKRFFRDEFGIDSRILWLPDVFGYSAALPQICAKSGIDVFLTSKISWNDTDRMPNDVFIWRGLDGTGIFTYFLTAQDKKRGQPSARYTTYVADTDPECIAGAYDRFSQKELSDEVLVTVGWGDGGGATTEKMLEKARRLSPGLPGCPAVRFSRAGDWLHSLKARTEGSLPEWRGELYLEYHRGTYTSAAKNKYLNRKSENLLRDTESALSCLALLRGGEFPAAEMDRLWKILLLNQFHDIIPGSSIPEVYEVSRRQYDDLICSSRTLLSGSREELLPRDPNGSRVAVFNPLPFAFSGIADGYEVKDIPPKGFAAVEAKEAVCNAEISEKCIRSSRFTVTFDDDMNITSVLGSDGTEYIRGTANRLYVCEDIPLNYDSWNIEDYHENKQWQVPAPVEVTRIRSGGRAGLRMVRRIFDSVITQDITVSDCDGRIDFRTKVDWKEKNLLLKTAFDAAVNADSAVYEVQFGHVTRPTHKNTSWDSARFEVCTHRYADISDFGGGIALLNDCKYGASADGSTLRLTLIKCSGYANGFIDLDTHEFTYSLFPHKGDFRTAGVINAAYELNEPPTAYRTSASGSFCPIRCDDPGVFFETFRPSADGRGYIFRGYEGFNRSCSPHIAFPFPVKEAFVCDLNENRICDLPEDGVLHLRPFEIVTVFAVPA